MTYFSYLQNTILLTVFFFIGKNENDVFGKIDLIVSFIHN